MDALHLKPKSKNLDHCSSNMHKPHFILAQSAPSLNNDDDYESGSKKKQGSSYTADVHTFQHGLST